MRKHKEKLRKFGEFVAIKEIWKFVANSPLQQKE